MIVNVFGAKKVPFPPVLQPSFMHHTGALKFWVKKSPQMGAREMK
jgi:hypothetical protein